MPVVPPVNPRPLPRPLPPPEPSARPGSRGWAEPVAPPREFDRPRPSAAESAEPAPPGHGLPASVLVGLALLPFVIPLLWLIAPLVTGQQPTLSVAAPAALAVAASALCLAVVYTADWSPATRIKGVLMLVGLAYFTGLSLFYLKKNMVDRVKAFFGTDGVWTEFRPPRGNCKVNLPGKPELLKQHPVPGWELTCYKASHKSLGREFVFIIGVGPDPSPRLATDEWFDEADKAIRKGVRGQVENRQPIKPVGTVPGFEWVIHRPEGTVRVVRIYRAKDAIYYLAAERPAINADDELADAFFQSFWVNPAKE